MVAAEEPGRVPYGVGAEARAGSICHTAVEGHPHDRDVAPIDLIAPRKTSERGWAREARNDPRVERTYGFSRGTVSEVAWVRHDDRC